MASELTKFELRKLVMLERFGDPATLARERDARPRPVPTDAQLRRQEVLRNIPS
jgi:hypothetical protein